MKISEVFVRTSYFSGHLLAGSSAARGARRATALAPALGGQPAMTILAVAVLGKENNPLYIHAFGPKESPLPHEEQMRYHLIVHTALDYIEERMAAQRQAAAGGGANMDMYLGMLYPIEQLRVYGQLTSCRIKLIAVIDDEEPKETELRALFRRLHALYVDTVSNPFHTYDSELYGSTSFQRQVERIVEAGLW